MVDVNSDFCAAVDVPKDKYVCETLQRLKAVDVTDVPIVLGYDDEGVTVSEETFLGEQKITEYSNAEFQEKFNGQKYVTYEEYKDARDFVDKNRSNPQMTTTALSQMSHMNQRIEYLEENYTNQQTETPSVTGAKITEAIL